MRVDASGVPADMLVDFCLIPVTGSDQGWDGDGDGGGDGDDGDVPLPQSVLAMPEVLRSRRRGRVRAKTFS